MNTFELEQYRKKLCQERDRVYELITQLKKNEVINSKEELASELSFYDNHPSDSSSELFDIEKGLAFKQNEYSILSKIDSALESIDKGNYGICKKCGNKISEERLAFLPYAEYCIGCQNEISNIKTLNSETRPVEESVLGNPFGYGYNDFDEEQVEFDAEDSYQAVERYNKLENIYEYYDDDDDYVEPIEKISNEEYKSQLPD